MTAFFRNTICKALRLTVKACVGLLPALILAACSGSDDEHPVPPREPAYITFGATKHGGGVEWANGRIGTRASESDVESAIPRNIGIFAFGDGANTTYIFRNQKAYYRNGSEFKPNGQPLFDWEHKQYEIANGVVTTNKIDNLWPYTTENGLSVQRPWEKMRYRFFAYSPWCETADVSVSAENYSSFNTFTWKKIPGFSADDYVLANEIIDVDNTGGTRTTPDAVHFRMRHILSRIRFFFKMSEDYRTIRRIELNSLTVITAGNVKTATFTFKNDAWDEIVHWAEQSGDADPVTLTNLDEQHYFIPTAYPAAPFTSVYVYPQEEFKELKLRLNYTVYDSAGHVTRNAEMTNTIEIKGPDGNGWNLTSGCYYDIFISIVPDYLYVLSDNDQDFDGWVIIKDS